jgi:hypothetical protein
VKGCVTAAASGPILTFASGFGLSHANVRIKRTTGKILSASGALDLTFASRVGG